MRTGAVVALSIPLVLAVTFLLMYIFGIDLQRISLGALVIALGLLVDDAIIAVEMMVVKMEQGWDRFRAATFAYTSTAFPMLTGTLITAVGFMPVGLARSVPANTPSRSSRGEHRAAGVLGGGGGVHPLPGLPAARRRSAAPPRRNARRRPLRDAVLSPVRATSSGAAASLAGDRRHRARFRGRAGRLGSGVQKQFFPASSRPELLVDLWLPNGASLKATEAQAGKSKRCSPSRR
jgi:multidrug efflux pump